MIGLELTESYVKMVELKETAQGLTLNSYRIVPLEVKEGDVDATIAGLIEKLVSQGDLSDTNVYTLVSGPMVQVRRVSLPPMPEADLVQAVKFEAHNFTTFPITETVVDYHVIEKNGGKDIRKLNVMILAIEKNAFKRLMSVINRGGLHCAGVTIGSFALKELLPSQLSFSKDELSAVLDVGLGSAVLSLFKNNAVQFIREIALGDQLPTEVLSSFTYYREQFFEEKIARLYLSGEIAQGKNLQESLASSLGIPVETIDPLRQLLPGPKVDAAKLNEDAPRLALVIGLARNGGRELNLVRVKEKAPKPIASARTLESLTIPNALVVGLFLLVVLVIIGANFYLNSSLEKTKKELAVKSLKLDQLTNFQERKAIYEEIRGQRTELKDLLGQITQLLPPDATLVELTFDNEKKHFSLSGETGAPESVSGFIMKLDRSAEFENVKLREIKIFGKLASFAVDFDLKKAALE